MARPVGGDPADTRTWSIRAAEALVNATAMQPGPARDAAMRQAEQLRIAAEMKGYLSSGELKPPN